MKSYKPRTRRASFIWGGMGWALSLMEYNPKTKKLEYAARCEVYSKTAAEEIGEMWEDSGKVIEE